MNILKKHKQSSNFLTIIQFIHINLDYLIPLILEMSNEHT